MTITNSPPRFSRRSAIGGLLAGGALLALPAGSAHAAVDGIAAVLMTRINAERQRHGLNPLPEDPRLSSVARAWSARMAGGVGLAHNPDDAAQYGWPVDASGEVVAYASDVTLSSEALAAQIVDNWMRSSGHRAILLGTTWTDIGVGWARSNSGRVYATANVIDAPLPAAGQEALSLSRELIADASAPRIVISRGDDAADALAGSALAGGDAPMLFTRPDRRLPDAVTAEISRIGTPATTVYLVGGTLPPETEDQVRATGATPVRLAGSSRYDTAAAVAREVARVRHPPRRIHIVRGDAWADAVSIAGVAARGGDPVLLVQRDHVPGSTAAVLETFPDADRLVVGGDTAISDATLAQVGGRRIAGADRAATGAVVMGEVWQRRSASPGDHLVVTPGWTADGWATALAHTTYAARHGAPLLFASTGVPPAVSQALTQSGYSDSTPATVCFARHVSDGARSEFLRLTGHSG